MTRLAPRPQPMLVPSYSLTGDLLSYESCPLQYRLFNRTGVRQSHPIQQWYGSFLHMGMRRAYDLCQEPGVDPQDFIWNEDDPTPPFSDLVGRVTTRLQAQGLHRPATLRELAERRLVRTIRVLGPLIFPLIKEAEVTLSAIRRVEGSGANEDVMYQVTGIVDVLAATAAAATTNNPLVEKLVAHTGDIPTDGGALELILDYKGMRRGEVRHMDTPKRQILTYAWLRNRRVGEPVVAAGAVIFVNDLLRDDDDVNLDPDDAELSRLLDAALVPVSVASDSPEEAAAFFDERVTEIEDCQRREGFAALEEVWEPTPKRETCAACDARYYCPKSDVAGRPRSRQFAPDAP
jgi:hypothetical protein